MSAAGPAVGTAVSGALLLVGMLLSSVGLGDVTVDSASFADSWSVALLAQAALGDALANPEVRVEWTGRCHGREIRELGGKEGGSVGCAEWKVTVVTIVPICHSRESGMQVAPCSACWPAIIMGGAASSLCHFSIVILAHCPLPPQLHTPRSFAAPGRCASVPWWLQAGRAWW